MKAKLLTRNIKNKREWCLWKWERQEHVLQDVRRQQLTKLRILFPFYVCATDLGE